MKNPCSFKEAEAHPSIFHIIFYEGITSMDKIDKNEIERGDIYKEAYSCISHLESVCKDDFREDPEVGDEIKNLRNGKEYSSIRVALADVDQYPATITIGIQPSQVQGLQKTIEDYLLIQAELRAGELSAKGGRESVLLLARHLADTQKGLKISLTLETD